MKKLIVLLFVAVVLMSLLIIPTASAGNVSISFSGKQNVKPGQTYTYNYEITMNEACGFFAKITCNNSELTEGDLSPSVDDLPENTNLKVSGSFQILINNTVKTGDTITITAKGKYSFKNGIGTPETCENISGSYTLTVVSDEDPTPAPTVTPSPEPIPTISEEPASMPSLEPPVASTPKPTTHSSDKPLKSASPVEHSETPQPTIDDKPHATIKPSTAPTTEALDTLSTELDTMANGSLITVSMNPSDSLLSTFTLNALKAKQGILIINFSDYSCKIDGSQLGNILGEPVNLSMDMTKTSVISEAADGQDLYQLHFSEAGDLPGCITYSFKALENQPGDMLYLYQYHMASELTEYKQSVSIDKDGCASFEIYEGGSYFVTSKHDTSNPETGETSEVLANPANNDIWMIVITIVCLVCAAAAVIAVLYSKKQLNIRNRGSNN